MPGLRKTVQVLLLAAPLMASGCGFDGEGMGDPDASVDGNGNTIDAAVDAPSEDASDGCATILGGPPLLPAGENPPWTNRGDAGSLLFLTPDSVRQITSGVEYGLISFETGLADLQPFQVEFRMRVNMVTTHAPAQSAAAFLYHYGSGVGGPADRAEMIYFDANQIGFGDNSTTAAIVDTSVYNDYRFEFDGADIRFLVNGTERLTRAGVTADDERIALGDSSPTSGINSDIEIQSVKLCTAP